MLADVTVLYRDHEFIALPEELAALKKHFPNNTAHRAAIGRNQLVIGRYSVLPYYDELESDVDILGSHLINTYRQHCYIADLHNWYADLHEYTPRTYFHLADVQGNGPFVLKGQTNSQKNRWRTHMFAPTREDVVKIYNNLAADSLIGQQSIYIREFVPLKTFSYGINGMPIVEEYRFFVVLGEVICGAFYWSSHAEDLKEQGIVCDASVVPTEFLNKLIAAIGIKANFYTLDVARTDAGEWILIEINDGQMAGLSENDPEVFYGNLAKAVRYTKEKNNEST